MKVPVKDHGTLRRRVSSHSWLQMSTNVNMSTRQRDSIAAARKTDSSVLNEQEEVSSEISCHSRTEVVVQRSPTYTLLSVFCTVVCTVLGAGMLTQPTMLTEGGWIIGSLIISGMAAAASYGIYTLSSVCIYVSKNDPLFTCTYPALGRYIMGPWGEVLVIATQDVSNFMVATIFIVLGGQELQQLFEQTGTWEVVPGDSARGHQVWMVFFFIIAAAPVIFLRGLRDLSVIAIYGGLASVVVAIATVISAATESSALAEQTVVVTSLVPASFSAVISAITSAVFSYGAAPQIPLLVSECPTVARRGLPAAAAGGLCFACAMYLMVAWTGYGIYGTSIEEVDGNILSKLSEGPATIIARVLVTTHVLCGYSLLVQVVLLQLERAVGLPEPYLNAVIPVNQDPVTRGSMDVDRAEHGEAFGLEGLEGVEEVEEEEDGHDSEEAGSSEEEIDDVGIHRSRKATVGTLDTAPEARLASPKREHRTGNQMVVGQLSLYQRLGSIGIRFAFCLVTLFLAEIVPFFGDLVNLTGAFAATASCLYIPFIFYMITFWSSIHLFEKIFLIFLTGIGIFITFAGTVIAVYAIVEHASTYTFF